MSPAAVKSVFSPGGSASSSTVAKEDVIVVFPEFREDSTEFLGVKAPIGSVLGLPHVTVLCLLVWAGGLSLSASLEPYGYKPNHIYIYMGKL